MDNTEKAAALLKNSRLFKEFSLPVIEAMIPMLHLCSFSANSLICLKGDVSDCLYIIRQGDVEISVSSSEGKIIVLGTLSEGDVFGEIGLLDKGTRMANVTAKTDILLYRLNNTDFEKLTPLFGVEELKALTSYICFLFRRTTNNLEEKSFMDADIRIARKIAELYEAEPDKKDNSFKVSISQESLGRMAGLSREATNKALASMQERGLIERQYKTIIVTDVRKFLQTLKDD